MRTVATPGGPRPASLFLTGLLTAGLALAGCSTTTTDSATAPSSAAVSLNIPAKDGPGVSATTVRISSSYFQDETKKTYEAIIAHYNKLGGLGGRTIVATRSPNVPVAMDAPPDQVAAAECKAYKAAGVFAEMATRGDTIPFLKTTCAQDMGIVTTVGPDGGSLIGVADDAMAGNPYLFAPSDMTHNRMTSTLALRLHDDGILDGVKKVAVLYDPENGQGEADLLVKKLTAGTPGLQVDKVSQGGPGGQASVLSMIVKMKQVGYDLVVPVGSSSGLAPKLSEFAAQKYTPKVAGFGFPVYTEAIAGVPPEFLKKVVVYDYRLNTGDLEPFRLHTMLTALPGAKDCYQILDQAGVSFGQDPVLPLTICSQLDFLRSAFKASGSKYLNAEAIAAGAGKLGDKYRSLECFGSTLTPARRDGANAVRKLVYDPQAKAFTFSDQNLPAAPQ